MNEGDHSEPDNDSQEEEEAVREFEVISTTGTKPKKKQKKKKKQQHAISEDVGDPDFFLDTNFQNKESVDSTFHTKPIMKKPALALEQKFLNPDNELKRIFGSRVVQSSQKKKLRGRAYVKSSWLVVPKPNWAQIKKTGLSKLILHPSTFYIFYFCL